jgi:hypothetical protein
MEIDFETVVNLDDGELCNLRRLVESLPYVENHPLPNGKGRLLAVEVWPEQWYSLVDILAALLPSKET